MTGQPDGRRGRTRDWLPTGGTLPPAAFETRHRTVVLLLWAHVIALPLFAMARGYPWYHGAIDTAPVLVCAVAAMHRGFSRRGRASIGALGLVTCSAVLTHLWGGITEAHFHFFVVVALLSLYEDWVPWGLAIAYVLVHHGVMGAIDPKSVFGDNLAAQHHPWEWAGIHAGFIGALALVNMVSWRSNEKARGLAAQAREALAHRATHDPLTGLPNRPAFVEHVERALDRRRRDPDRSGNVAVMFVDVDDFKLVNDSLGHNAGDRLLEQLGRRLTDAVGPNDVVARFGGDEFVVLIAEVRDEPDARRIAQHLVAALVAPIDLDGESRFVTASVGMALAGEGDADKLLQEADAAMYRAKANGKARCDTFDDSLRADAIRRITLESGLREALVREQLTLVYQPQVRLPAGDFCGVEALIRWQHPELGAISPVEFIPMAERLGLIEDIGAWVLWTACAEAAAWKREDVEISVNVSPRQLSQPDFAEVVRAALETSGLAPHRLCLEVTETALLVDVEAAHAMLGRLRDLGVLLAVDDFGVGHASLRHLRQLLPVDVLKIDKSFVEGLTEDREDSAIVAAVVAMAAGLGLDCVAEGVETAEQAAMLGAMGCSNAQGWHFARPMSAPALRATLTPAAPVAA